MKHYNPSIAEDMTRLFNLKSLDQVSELGEVIHPVVLIERYCNIVRDVFAVNAVTGLLFTTPADKDFYLVSAEVAVIKDVTSQSTSTDIQISVEGTVRRLIGIPGITLTVQNSAVSINFPKPVKVDRNTAINLKNSNATANITAFATIQGFTVETIKGT